MLLDRVPPPTPLSGSLNGKSHSGMLPTEDSSSPPLVTASSPHSSVIEENGAAMTDQEPPPGDPSCPIKGMYRLLDLITEQGKNCLGNNPFVAVYTTLTTSPQLIKSWSPKSLSRHSSTHSPRVLILPSQPSTSRH